MICLATDIDQFERERQHQFSSAPSQLQSLSSLSSCNKKRLFPEHLSRANMLTELASLPKKGNQEENEQAIRLRREDMKREAQLVFKKKQIFDLTRDITAF